MPVYPLNCGCIRATKRAWRKPNACWRCWWTNWAWLPAITAMPCYYRTKKLCCRSGNSGYLAGKNGWQNALIPYWLKPWKNPYPPIQDKSNPANNKLKRSLRSWTPCSPTAEPIYWATNPASPIIVWPHYPRRCCCRPSSAAYNRPRQSCRPPTRLLSSN